MGVGKEGRGTGGSGEAGDIREKSAVGKYKRGLRKSRKIGRGRGRRLGGGGEVGGEFRKC